MEDLKKTHIVNKAIQKTAVKTGERINVPLSTFAKSILAKYGNDPRTMMVIHRNHINMNLKKIGIVAGIDAPVEKKRSYGVREEVIMQPKHERLSLHVGRKTFVTFLLSQNVSTTNVMALSGHRSFKSFKRYVDVADTQRVDAINSAFG